MKAEDSHCVRNGCDLLSYCRKLAEAEPGNYRITRMRVDKEHNGYIT